MRQVSGSSGAEFDGTYERVADINGRNAWKRPGMDQYIWDGRPTHGFFCDEFPMVELDDDNLAYVQMFPNGVRGRYLWWELSHDDVTVPVTAGSFGYDGQWDGRPYFTKGAPDWFLWRDPNEDLYRLTDQLGAGDLEGDDWWLADNPGTPLGGFTAHGTAQFDFTIDMPADPDCQITPIVP